MKVLDPGHDYKLHTLDGEADVRLTFVKRCNPPEKYPGNTSAYPGTTIQEVLRCLIDRLQYLDRQKRNPINQQIVYLLRLAIWLLEVRAAEHKNLHLSTHALEQIELASIQDKDGHVI